MYLALSASYRNTVQLRSIIVPFNPPRRRSSLAFSKIVSNLVANDDGEDHEHIDTRAPSHPDSIASGRKSIVAPSRQSGASPGHVTQVQRVFQSAQATLHLDMHFAASPEGSIGSRLPCDSSPRLDAHFEARHNPEVQDITSRNWRYSTMPQLLATTTLDVREPMPCASPTLPETDSPHVLETPVAFEPTSSGFASPIADTGQNSDADLPPLPPSSPPLSCEDDNLTALESPLNNLKVEGDGLSEGSDMDLSPLEDHHEDLSTTVSGNPIFLSQSANAAAESAKARRGLGRTLILESNDTHTFDDITIHSESVDSRLAGTCPDPAIHRLIGSRLCPDPGMHSQIHTPQSFVNHSPGPNTRYRQETYKTTGASRLGPYPAPSIRASDTGSPLPPHRSRAPLSPVLPSRFPQHSYQETHSPTSYRVNRPCRPLHNPLPPTNEHFQPGWYYARGSPQRRHQPGGGVYSFSTAAAKVTGESVAPDFRIRDSYRTDTLTPLVKPLNRYRKNGLGANISARGSARFYGSSSAYDRPLGRVNTYSTSNDYENMDRVRFQSSPPRPSTSNISEHDIRKRRRNPRAYTPESDIESPLANDYRFTADDSMIIDDDTRAAVRMSIFGSSTPEPLHDEREGIRELSPNVSTWRKGMRGGPHSRKKRRPSYWDGDLKEVKNSPAGRGGISSSPTISKRSMVAEMESMSAAASINYESLNMDDNRIHVYEDEKSSDVVLSRTHTILDEDLDTVNTTQGGMDLDGEREYVAHDVAKTKVYD